jgi:hypothetical protein
VTTPNVVNTTTINGTLAVQVIAATATAIVTNSAASGLLYKINALYVANVDGTSNYTVNIDVYRSSTAYRLAYQVVVPAAATLDVLSKPIYLNEGDSLRLTGSSASKLEAICSYEVIS